ncbi:hypothetical protein GTY88_10545, partial [Streptomyces sp. SID5926]|nr:hypothetical protein [Streptomyces sp. SID5926]
MLTRFTSSGLIDPSGRPKRLASVHGRPIVSGERTDVMGMKTKIALGAVVGIAVIGALSANAGDGDAKSDDRTSASAGEKQDGAGADGAKTDGAGA